MLDVADDRIFKLPGGRFVTVANVHEHHVRIFLQRPLPIRGAEVIVLVRCERHGGAECNDFGPDLDDEFREGIGVAGGNFHFDVRETRVVAERGHVFIHRVRWTGEGAIDAFAGDQDAPF